METIFVRVTLFSSFLLVGFLLSERRAMQHQLLQSVDPSHPHEAATTAQPAPRVPDNARENRTSRTDFSENFSLPSCSEIMSRPHSSLVGGDFITRTPHEWILQADGSRRFELTSTCRLKRYTAEEARRCLSEKHISMIGDSLTRYQYLSLVYFIHKGVWPPNFGMSSSCHHFMSNNTTTCSSGPHICLEKDFYQVDPRNNGWSLYHEVLGDVDGILDGHLECQCRRGGGHMNVNMVYENYNITLTHFMEAGWIKPDPIQGWNFTGCSRSGTCRYSKEHGDELLKRASFDWQQNITDILDPVTGILPTMFPKTDHVLYNRGIWGGLPKERAAIILPLLRNWTSDRCFYKATTSGIRKPPLTRFDQEAADIAYEAGCSFLDFGFVTEQFGKLRKQDPERDDIYWDELHFIPWVYNELNNILLNVLCNANS